MEGTSHSQFQHHINNTTCFQLQHHINSPTCFQFQHHINSTTCFQFQHHINSTSRFQFQHHINSTSCFQFHQNINCTICSQFQHHHVNSTQHFQLPHHINSTSHLQFHHHVNSTWCFQFHHHINHWTKQWNWSGPLPWQPCPGTSTHRSRQRSQSCPVTPGRQRQRPVWSSQPTAPSVRQTHSGTTRRIRGWSVAAKTALSLTERYRSTHRRINT